MFRLRNRQGAGCLKVTKVPGCLPTWWSTVLDELHGFQEGVAWSLGCQLATWRGQDVLNELDELAVEFLSERQFRVFSIDRSALSIDALLSGKKLPIL
eukprot:409247-Prorocentrum_minimum.AAC.2